MPRKFILGIVCKIVILNLGCTVELPGEHKTPVQVTPETNPIRISGGGTEASVFFKAMG